MAAAPGGEVPPSSLLLPPAKRLKQDPSFPQASPADPAMAAEDCSNSKWSTLQPDLVRRVADSFLATNDLDCYIHLRAVCPGWRAATDVPRSDTVDPRFRPRRWVVLDEDFQSQEEEMLLLNTHTGRFLHRKLPLLSDHYVVATTRNGYLVLAAKSPPHAASLLNPLTGVVISFVAPVPPEVGSADVLFFGSSSPPVIVLFCDSSHMMYTAYPDSKRFAMKHRSREFLDQVAYDFFRKAVVGGVFADTAHAVVADLCMLMDSLDDADADIAKFFSVGLRDAKDLVCFPVCLATHMLLVLHTKGSSFVYKNDVKTCKPVALDSISNYAIFVGHQRCLAVDADKFPGIEANCIYHTEILGSSAHICKCNNKDRKVERISEVADFMKQDKKFVFVTDRPLTIIHLLSSYTINIPDSQLALQQIP